MNNKNYDNDAGEFDPNKRPTSIITRQESQEQSNQPNNNKNNFYDFENEDDERTNYGEWKLDKDLERSSPDLSDNEEGDNINLTAELQAIFDKINQQRDPSFFNSINEINNGEEVNVSLVNDKSDIMSKEENSIMSNFDINKTSHNVNLDNINPKELNNSQEVFSPEKKLTMQEILSAAKQKKPADIELSYHKEGQKLDPSNLTLEERLRLHRSANDPNDPERKAILQMRLNNGSMGAGLSSFVREQVKKIQNGEIELEEDKDIDK